MITGLEGGNASLHCAEVRLYAAAVLRSYLGHSSERYEGGYSIGPLGHEFQRICSQTAESIADVRNKDHPKAGLARERHSW